MKRKFGNCYEAAFKTLLHNINNKELRLVHGEVIGNKPDAETYGKPIGHAWLEIGNIVIDPSDHFEWPKIVNKQEYYKLGQINYLSETHRVYDLGEAIVKTTTTFTYGPWPDGPADYTKLNQALKEFKV